MIKALRRAGVAAAVAVLCVISAACEEKNPVPEPAVTVTQSVTADAVSPWKDEFDNADPFTALVVQLSWGQQTEESKQAMCDSIEMFGVEWAAQMLKDGGESAYENDYQIDWDRAAVLVEERCRIEGY